MEKNKALEINTKIFPRQESVRRAEDIIKMYTEAGGRKFTLGPDSHTADRHRNGFDVVVKLLKKYGINKISMFIGRKEYLLDI